MEESNTGRLSAVCDVYVPGDKAVKGWVMYTSYFFRENLFQLDLLCVLFRPFYPLSTGPDAHVELSS